MTSAILSRRCELYQINRSLRLRISKFCGALIYFNFFGHIDTPTNQISSTEMHEFMPNHTNTKFDFSLQNGGIYVEE